MRDRPNDRHRRIAAHQAGRPLSPGEVVHHADEDKANNRPDNLQVQTRGAHTAAHNKGRKLSKLRRALRQIRDNQGDAY